MPVLAISGKKQSGKNTTTDFIVAKCLEAGVSAAEFSFADPLKRLAIDVLGLEERQCYGTDADKNTEVPHLLWDNFPVQECRRVYRPGTDYVARIRVGPMTAREVLQFWGSEIYRKASPNVWADATARRITKWLERNPGGVALNADCRFPNEAEAIKGVGGRVLRLTRNPLDDRHQSETALDSYDAFDFILDNAAMSVDEQLDALTPVLRDWGVLPMPVAPLRYSREARYDAIPRQFDITKTDLDHAFWFNVGILDAEVS